MGEAQEFEQRLKEVADRITVALDQLIPPAGGPGNGRHVRCAREDLAARCRGA